MSWFSKLIPVHVEEVAAQTDDLIHTVEQDKKLLEAQRVETNEIVTPAAEPIVSVAPKGVVHKRVPTHVGRGGSSLSPFASRILEKAKSEALKDEEDRGKITSPAELFAQNGEAEKRIERIKSIAFEKSKHAADKFIHGGRTIPNTNFLVQHHLASSR